MLKQSNRYIKASVSLGVLGIILLLTGCPFSISSREEGGKKTGTADEPGATRVTNAPGAVQALDPSDDIRISKRDSAAGLSYIDLKRVVVERDAEKLTVTFETGDEILTKAEEELQAIEYGFILTTPERPDAVTNIQVEIGTDEIEFVGTETEEDREHRIDLSGDYKIDGSQLIMNIPLDDIGDPASFEWQVWAYWTFWDEPDIPVPQEGRDFVPDSGWFSFP